MAARDRRRAPFRCRSPATATRRRHCANKERRDKGLGSSANQRANADSENLNSSLSMPISELAPIIFTTVGLMAVFLFFSVSEN
jgi:hypothetical protein